MKNNDSFSQQRHYQFYNDKYHKFVGQNEHEPNTFLEAGSKTHRLARKQSDLQYLANKQNSLGKYPQFKSNFLPLDNESQKQQNTGCFSGLSGDERSQATLASNDSRQVLQQIKINNQFQRGKDTLYNPFEHADSDQLNSQNFIH